VLKDTLGVFLYQESVLGAAVALAGFSPGEADELRRAMGSKRSAEKMAALEGRFLAGAAAKGVSGATARAVFDAIRAFSSYGFVKAHSCSFARLAYETAWLKRHHPVAFWAARLTAQPGGGWPVGAYINAARRDGVTVLGPDLGRSAWRCTIEEAPAGPAVRLGLWFVRGLAGDAGPRLVAERDRRGAFRDLSDLCRRAREFLTPTAIEALIAAGACDGWGLPRRALLWRLPAAWRGATGLDLPPAAPDLPPADPGETLAGEAWAAGAALGGHPVALTRSALDAAGIVPLRALATAPAGMSLAVAGRAVLIRRPPTADGICFVSLEDETAVATLVLDEATDRRDRARLHAPLVVAEGRVVRRRGVPTLRVTMLRSFVADPPSRSGPAPA
jgi:error-prone DNA polymerase